MGDSHTLVTVQVGEASGLASKRGPIRVVGSLELVGTNGGQVDSTFREVASRSRRGNPNWNTETINERDVVEVLSTVLA